MTYRKFELTPTAAYTNEKIDPKILQLRQRHSLYSENINEWLFFLSAYEGGQQFINPTNIHKHVREVEDDYQDRLKRAHNMNYCEPIVDFFTNFIFSETIDRDGGTNKDWFDKFINNVDRKGTTINAFMKDVCDDVHVFGMSYILVEAPKKTPNITTKQDEIDNQIYPYLVLVKPIEIIDWDLDEFGKYTYLKRCCYRTKRIGGSKIDVEVYTEYTASEIVVTTVDVSNPGKPKVMGAPEVIKNELGVVPVVVSKFKPSKSAPEIGLSFLRDFAYNNREIVNLTSVMQEFMYRQAFNILVKETDGVTASDQSEATIGTMNAMEVPKGAKYPAYIAPDVAPAEYLQSERARLKTEIFVRASQDTMNELFNGEKSSGYSQAQSFSKTVPFISTRADVLEHTEVAVLSLALRYSNKVWDGKIKYKDRYELTNLTDALTQLMMLARDLGLPSVTFIKEEFKRMVKEFDGKLPSETLNKIEEEIDSMDFDEWKSSHDKARSDRSATEQQKSKSTGTMMEIAAEANNQVGAVNKLK